MNASMAWKVARSVSFDIKKLFKGGFSTGHGYLREPNDIASYAALACIAAAMYSWQCSRWG